jgi:tetratricopeptide (TPR) repeat protein
VLPLRFGGDPDAELAYSTATILKPLTPVDDSVADRERAFRAAADAFARRMGSTLDELPIPDLGQQLFEQILFVHLAALSALEGQHALLTGRVLRDDLLQSALERESRYWADTASARSLELGPVPLERAVALATLTVAASEDEAASALTAVPELADASQQLLRETARWLRDLYPPPATQPVASHREEPPWFWPLTPELLGEALLAGVLETAPALPARLLNHATEVQATRTFAVLTQAARTHTSATHALRTALTDHLPRLWRSALTAAQQAGDPLGFILADVLEQTPQPELASQIASSLPEQSVALREFAAVATGQAIEAIRQREPGADRDAELASLANNQSVRLGDLGRREEALAAIEEATTTYRRLAEARPDAFLPDLATSLNNQSSSLSDLGRREEALAAIEEAIHLVLPMLERGAYVLPDFGLRLVQSYLESCEQVDQEIDDEIVQRMHSVLVSAGMLPSEAT